MPKGLTRRNILKALGPAGRLSAADYWGEGKKSSSWKTRIGADTESIGWL